MNSFALKLAVGFACLSLAAPAAISGERVTGAVALTTVSAACPAGLLAAGKPVAVNFMLPERVDGGDRSAPTVTISGEFQDFAVQGCTVAFSGGTADALTYVAGDVDGIVLGRGCRGYCGL